MSERDTGMNIEELKKTIVEMEHQVDVFRAEIDELQEALAAARSRLWIQENNVTADQVQASRAAGIPWFVSLYEFSDWFIMSRNTKPYAEWNGNIYEARALTYRTTALRSLGRVRELDGWPK